MQQLSVNLKEHYPALCADVRLDLFLQRDYEYQPRDFLRPTMLVLPGGGYKYVSEREAEPIALAYLALGYDVACLYYHCSTPHPQPLAEAACALAYLRKSAPLRRGDPKRVFCVGFSAGGHLAAHLGTSFSADALAPVLGEDQALSRPDAMVLAYPLLSLTPAITHIGSYRVLAGDDGAAEFDPALAPVNNIGEDTPPAFLWTTFNDGTVDCRNALEFASEMKANGKTFELHVWADGPHGLALCNEITQTDYKPSHINPDCARWIELSHRFLQRF